MLEMFRLVVPELVNVKVFAALAVSIVWRPNYREAGEMLAAPLIPTPLRVTDCGLPPALSVMVRVPVSDPVAIGEKVT